jgi:hypothetical protein
VVGGILWFHIALDLEEDELGSVLGHRGVSMRGPGTVNGKFVLRGLNKLMLIGMESQWEGDRCHTAK